MFGMRKFLIAFIALGLAKHFPLYGVYPPAKEVLRQLCGEKGLDSTFKQAFWEVWKEASSFGFQNFPILGEKQGLITFFDKDLEPFGTSVSQKQKVNSIWGEFSWKLNGTEISKAEQIWSAIEKSICHFRMRVAKTLQRFVKRFSASVLRKNFSGRRQFAQFTDIAKKNRTHLSA